MKLVDLTHPLGPSTTFWPTEAPFRLEVESAGRTPAGYWDAANRFCTAEHGGTHLDAPYHFAERGQKLDEIPLRRYAGPACVLDVSARAAGNPDYTAMVEDLARWEERNGRLPEGAILSLRTGWSKRWENRKGYLGDDAACDASRLHFQSFSKELAEFLVRDRRIKGATLVALPARIEGGTGAALRAVALLP